MADSNSVNEVDIDKRELLKAIGSVGATGGFLSSTASAGQIEEEEVDLDEFATKPIYELAIDVIEHPKHSMLAFTTSVIDESLGLYIATGVSKPKNSYLPREGTPPGRRATEVIKVAEAKTGAIMQLEWHSKTEISYWEAGEIIATDVSDITNKLDTGNNGRRSHRNNSKGPSVEIQSQPSDRKKRVVSKQTAPDSLQGIIETQSETPSTEITTQQFDPSRCNIPKLPQVGIEECQDAGAFGEFCAKTTSIGCMRKQCSWGKTPPLLSVPVTIAEGNVGDGKVYIDMWAGLEITDSGKYCVWLGSEAAGVCVTDCYRDRPDTAEATKLAEDFVPEIDLFGAAKFVGEVIVTLIALIILAIVAAAAGITGVGA
ncbi:MULTISPECIES: hypothetical protein [Halomicrobium]|uniref:Uncharacterized protein n=2 Tax=Halomicrobium mukohataei TaxID=57705 RepID=C7NX55_HALMD|nr:MULTISPECIES: hypothetical protein [Halomicrobium]ACV46420.1 hypothetical protein Hmuk_0283 [Halomicrobium mukohataei DSM 12286]QCD64972.1 hypothetical protein E5139_04710 [Halomicrobium mukohataei]QFR19778.1 hypothetical protein GBQ70_04705 [Halomicrobium sp. ZPS1]